MANAPAKETTATEPEMPPAKSVLQTAHDYMVPVSADAVQQWAGKEEAFADYAREQAKGMYPTFAPAIDQGITTRALLAPYEATAQHLLGSQTVPNWDEPKWQAAMTGGRTDKGQPAPMGQAQWRDHITNTREFGYEYTPQAIAQAKSLVQDMHDAMHGQVQ